MRLTELLWGPLLPSPQVLPLRLQLWLCDLRPRFLAKGRVRQNYRAIARNGRVMLATDRPLADLTDRPARARLQVWHRAILPGDRPEPYGIVFYLRSVSRSLGSPVYRTRMVKTPAPGCSLALDLGGGLVLEFQRIGEW